MENSSSDKQALRRVLRERVRSIPTDSRSGLSKFVCDQVLEHRIYHFNKSVLLYMPLQDEIDVSFLQRRAMEEGREVALPRFVPERGAYAAFFIGNKPLEQGAFGVLEPALDLPVPLNRLDLVIVPGLGFDLRGRRLGRGKGFYDRMLSEVSGVKCGVCFDEQIVESIPVEAHDVGVDFLATPTRWLDCRGSTPEMR